VPRTTAMRNELRMMASYSEHIQGGSLDALRPLPA
jgi:hypothetical protein